MNTRWISKRWLEVTLLSVALFSLLAAVTLQVRLGQHASGLLPEPVIRRSPPGSASRSAENDWTVEYEMTAVELDAAGNTGPKQFEFVSPGEGTLDYLLEREGAAQDVGFAPRAALRSAESDWAVEYEMTGVQLDSGGTGWEAIQFAPVNSAYWEYLVALETSETDR